MTRNGWRQVVGVVVAGLLWAGPALGQVVISEFRFRGPQGGNDEFIELYNAGDQAVDISGYKVWGSNSSGTTSVRAEVPAGTVMPPKTFYLLVNAGSNGYSGAVPGDQTYSTGIADDGGLGLTDNNDNLLDAVGLSVGSAYQEGSVLSEFSSTNKNQSYERTSASCGPDQDTDNNAADFVYHDGISYPQNAGSCRFACAGEPCISTPEPICKDEGTSVQYGTATCDAEQCVYPSQEVSCEFGCDPATGLCAPDPCEGVVCDAPPNAQCFEAAGTCADGVCSYEQFEAGTGCDDGDVCTELDSCDGDGQCAGAPVVCPAKDPECVDAGTSRAYSAGTCDPGTGDCLYEPTDTPCEFGCDGATGLCLGDPCAGVVCDEPPSQCHASPGTCSGGTCTYVPLAQGAPCDDGNACTQGDACDGQGGCAGTPLACDQPPGPCHEATGECVDGNCVYPAQAQGTPCDDQDPCTTDDVCDGAGLCAGTPDPECVPPDGGEDPGPGDALPTPDDGVSPPDDADAADPGPGPQDVPDAVVTERLVDLDTGWPSDRASWPDFGVETLIVETVGRDAEADAGPTPSGGGGGGCSAGTGPSASMGGWLALLACAAWGLRVPHASRRSRPRGNHQGAES